MIRILNTIAVSEVTAQDCIGSDVIIEKMLIVR
jgi:hypothetical protein